MYTRHFIGTRVFICLLLVFLYTLGSTADEICCCPDFTVNLKCTDKTDTTPKTSLLKANGYVCDALESSDVTLECNVKDLDHAAVKKVKYTYYKIYEIATDKIAYNNGKAEELTACDETESTCTLSAVKWSGEVYSATKFANFDNFIYQCLVEITLIDDTTTKLPSNTMHLDVYKFAKKDNQPEPNDITEEAKTPLSIGKAYEKLTCGKDDDVLPSTNPRTRAKWSFKKLDSTDDWKELNIPKDKPRMGLVEPDIADESKEFLEGTLIIMLFNPTEDAGHYKCEAVYETTTVGTPQTYLRALYKITSTDQDDHGSKETKILSAITSDKFTLKDKHVDFTCYARDTDASEPDKFQWVHGDNDDIVSSDDFSDVEILNHGRTLRLPSEYKYNEKKFKCQVLTPPPAKNKHLSKVFTQPVIAPQVMDIPITTRSCSNPDSAIELESNKKLMMSNAFYADTNPVQILPGATATWMINDKSVSNFTNPTKDGGATMDTHLTIPESTFKATFGGDATKKCRYVSFLQSRSNGYQLPEVLKLTTPSAKSCENLICTDFKVEFTDGDEPTIDVNLGVASAQCIRVEVKTENGTTVYDKPFGDPVAPSCSLSTMKITKEDTGQESLNGQYTVSVYPEGKDGCSETISTGGGKKNNTGLIVGIVVAVIVVIGVIVGVLIYKNIIPIPSSDKS